MSHPQQALKHYDDLEEHEEGVAIVTPGALAILQESEINRQIVTAKKYPRSLTKIRKELTDLATLAPEVAQRCMYALERTEKGSNQKKAIIGPSIRFAEILQSVWGNIRTGARVVHADDEFITAQGFAFDLEKNSATASDIRRRITGRDGKRFGTDMIGVTGNAACAIAKRNAILAIVPRAYWEEAFQKVREVVAGNAATLVQRRNEAVKAMLALKFRDGKNVTKQHVYGVLGVAGHEEITTDHLVVLAGTLQTIKDKVQTVDEAFAPEKMIVPSTAAGDGAAPPGPERSDFKAADKKGTRKKAEKEPETKKDGDPPQGETQSTSGPDKSKPAETSTEAENVKQPETKTEPAKAPEPVMFAAPGKTNADWWKEQLENVYTFANAKSVESWHEDMQREFKGDTEALELVQQAVKTQLARIDFNKKAAKK